MGVIAAIERNRIALLRLVFCWLLIATALFARGQKPLPRRITHWVFELLYKAEKATGFLLIAACYNAQLDIHHVAHLKLYAASNKRITHCVPTVDALTQRLKSLQHILLNLHIIARCIALKAALIAFIQRQNCHRKTNATGSFYNQSMFSNYTKKAIAPP